MARPALRADLTAALQLGHPLPQRRPLLGNDEIRQELPEQSAAVLTGQMTRGAGGIADQPLAVHFEQQVAASKGEGEEPIPLQAELICTQSLTMISLRRHRISLRRPLDPLFG